MPETAERPVPQEEQEGVHAEQPTHDELRRTAEQLAQPSSFDHLIADEMKKLEGLSEAEIDELLATKIRQHEQTREKIQETAARIDDLTNKVIPFAVTNLRGEGSITLRVKDEARGFLSQFGELGSTMANLNQESELLHTEAAADMVAAGKAPNEQTLTVEDVVAAVKAFDAEDSRYLEQQLQKKQIPGTDLVGKHQDIIQDPVFKRYGGELSSMVKFVAKYRVHPRSHLLEAKMSLVNMAKNQLERILNK